VSDLLFLPVLEDFDFFRLQVSDNFSVFVGHDRINLDQVGSDAHYIDIFRLLFR